LDQEILEQAEIQVKYSGYIEKERNKKNADKLLLEKMLRSQRI
jgi:tRNA uridine 5-carboxymethylaminomethyl modification enzyme